MDFMLDDNFKLYLIEINANPDLNVHCAVQSKVIPPMLSSLFKIALDPIFPPPNTNHPRKTTMLDY
jgi:hypothetical protein